MALLSENSNHSFVPTLSFSSFPCLKIDNSKRFYLSRRALQKSETEAEDRTLDEIDTQEEDVVESIFHNIKLRDNVKTGGKSWET